MTRTKKNAQILVITLLTLTIVGILVTTIILVTRRDFQQSANTEKYERLYNIADNNLQSLLADYSSPTVEITSLPSECAAEVLGSLYRCQYTNEDSSSFTTNTNIFVENKKNIDDYVLRKDSALILDITNYSGGFAFQWDKDNIALEVAVIFSNQEVNGRLNIVRDIYDRNSDKVIFSQIQPGFSNLFPFVPNDSMPVRGFSLELSSIFSNSPAIPGFINANSYTPLYLAIIPRSNNVLDEILLDVTPTSPGTLRDQVREFRTLAEDPADFTGPKVSLVVRVPLVPEIPTAVLNGITTSGNLVLQ